MALVALDQRPRHVPRLQLALRAPRDEPAQPPVAGLHRRRRQAAHRAPLQELAQVPRPAHAWATAPLGLRCVAGAPGIRRRAGSSTAATKEVEPSPALA